MNKKQIVFLVCIVVLVIGAIFFFLKDKNDPLSGEFQETGDKTVTYGG